MAVSAAIDSEDIEGSTGDDGGGGLTFDSHQPHCIRYDSGEDAGRVIIGSDGRRSALISTFGEKRRSESDPAYVLSHLRLICRRQTVCLMRSDGWTTTGRPEAFITSAGAQMTES